MKLRKLHIKNFGCFGAKGQDVDIDNIVVLIGPNNVGKSTVLDAYEAFVSVGSPLSLDKFHDEKAENHIELIGSFVDIVDGDKETIGIKYIHEDSALGECVKVKWEWDEPDAKATKYSWNEPESKWDKGGVGGWDTLIASRLPVPLRIQPADTPEKLESTIREILTSAIKKSLKTDSSAIKETLETLQKLTDKFSDEVKDEVKKTCLAVQESLRKVFAGVQVELIPEYGGFQPDKVLGAGSHIRIKDGAQSIPLKNQGTGIQRAFLWSAIASLADQGRLKKGKTIIKTDKPRVLLIDEPESFLHPPLVRQARESLYAISDIDGWQVIASTHSPVLIDVSKPHTSIVRVDNRSDGHTNLYSTEKDTFNEEEKIRLRMIRSCHPTVNEFFFAERVILVEGETELAVLNKLFEDDLGNTHIVNCMGKGNIPMFARILNQFGVPYIIIHDCDSPKAKRDDKWITNGMWTMNTKIREASGCNCKLILSVPDFEGYYFNVSLSGDKPFHAICQINREDFDTAPELEKLRKLKKQIKDESHPCIYSCETSFLKLFTEYISTKNLENDEQWKI